MSHFLFVCIFLVGSFDELLYDLKLLQFLSEFFLGHRRPWSMSCAWMPVLKNLLVHTALVLKVHNLVQVFVLGLSEGVRVS